MTPSASFRSSLPGIRPASGWVLGGFVCVHTVLLSAVHAPEFARWVATPVRALTGGWVTHELIATLLMAVVLVGGLLWGVGRLRASDLALSTGWASGWKLLNAVLVAYLLWGLAQLLVAVGGLLGLTEIAANPAWIQPLRPSLVGASALTVLAAAALEELMYRGFFFVHLLLALRRWGIVGERWQMGGALAGSQLFFGLNHLPVGLDAGFTGGVLGLYVLQVTFVGVLFAVLFMQTTNLFLVIGVHALINAPVLPFVGGIDASFVVLLLALALMLGHSLLGRSRIPGIGRPSPAHTSVLSSPGRPFDGRN
jgi:membrane protease YdiL (CAAX protease family)